MSSLTDARGVTITPGDTALYGFDDAGGVAMAEAVVLGDRDDVAHPGSRVNTWPCINEDVEHDGPRCECGPPKVSLTPSGRVRLRVVRRSGIMGGTKPVVDVAPDRLVVLKPLGLREPREMYLPPSPLPTQAEANRQQAENLIEAYTADLRAKMVPDRHYYEGWTLERFHAYAAKRLTELRAELRAIDEV
jgi:hypothetical protein